MVPITGMWRSVVITVGMKPLDKIRYQTIALVTLNIAPPLQSLPFNRYSITMLIPDVISENYLNGINRLSEHDHKVK